MESQNKRIWAREVGYTVRTIAWLAFFAFLAYGYYQIMSK